MEPTEAQVKELWEWCGLKVTWQRDKFVVVEGELIEEIVFLDLNNLFKYAVPKLAKESLWCQLAVINIVPGYVACVKSNSGVEKPSTYSEDPTLALFWAIYEVMK